VRNVVEAQLSAEMGDVKGLLARLLEQ